MRRAVCATILTLAVALNRPSVALAQVASDVGAEERCDPEACLDEVARIHEDARAWSQSTSDSDNPCVRDGLGALDRIHRRATVEFREYRQLREHCGIQNTDCAINALGRARNLQQVVQRARERGVQIRTCQPTQGHTPQPTQTRDRTRRILGYSMVIGGGALLVPLGVSIYQRDAYLTNVRTCDAMPSMCAGVADQINTYNSLGVAIPIMLVLSGILIGTGSLFLLQSE